jgi:hypothetical protein
VPPSDRPRWHEAIVDAKRMRRQRGLSPLQLSAIDTQITVMQSVIDEPEQEEEHEHQRPV